MTIQEGGTSTVSKKTSNTRAVPPVQKTGQTPTNLTGAYVSLLSGNPASQSHRISIEPTETPSTQTTDSREIDLTNSSDVWNHAMSLATSGQAGEAAKFFKLHENLSLSKKNNSETSTQSSTNTTVHPLPVISKGSSIIGEAFSEGGITFIPGAITSHMDIGFTPYFDRNLRELKGPIPLTIFNRQWQELANGYHVEKRVKLENLSKDITTYTGFPYPHEMTQSYSTWNMNYRNFVRTLRDVYHFKKFAEWAEIHQANVEFYHTRDNWMTAFRYDIKIRLNAFAFRVTHNGTNAPPDISQKREDIAAICFAETRRLDEGSFEDNPYAKGGSKFGFEWTTGLPRSSNNQSSSYNSGVTTSSTSTSNDHSNSQHAQSNGAKRPHRQGGGGRPRGGYQGNNYDPNHASKKQSTTKGSTAPSTT